MIFLNIGSSRCSLIMFFDTSVIDIKACTGSRDRQSTLVLFFPDHFSNLEFVAFMLRMPFKAVWSVNTLNGLSRRYTSNSFMAQTSAPHSSSDAEYLVSLVILYL